jgi:hypothetical protein
MDKRREGEREEDGGRVRRGGWERRRSMGIQRREERWNRSKERRRVSVRDGGERV